MPRHCTNQVSQADKSQFENRVIVGAYEMSKSREQTPTRFTDRIRSIKFVGRRSVHANVNSRLLKLDEVANTGTRLVLRLLKVNPLFCSFRTVVYFLYTDALGKRFRLAKHRSKHRFTVCIPLSAMLG
ncbi:MAG: hypothetical protein CMJ80_17740 [Planctomycetaceae bacterium]|nr:hypothetical protein [Planctomycetaceae bacterium]